MSPVTLIGTDMHGILMFPPCQPIGFHVAIRISIEKFKIEKCPIDTFGYNFNQYDNIYYKNEIIFYFETPLLMLKTLNLIFNVSFY